LLTALIDPISRQVWFTVGIPRQHGTPRSTRPQHKNTSNDFYPVHRILLLCSPRVGTPFPEKPTSHAQESMWNCPTDLATRGELEEVNHSPRYCSNKARCMPSQQEDGRNKIQGNQRWIERRSKVGAGRLYEKADDRWVKRRFFGRIELESFAYWYSAQMSCEAPGEAGRAVYRDRGGASADATRDGATCAIGS